MRISFPVLLFLVFLVLKLVGVIAWSWWAVTAPLWIGLVLVILVWAVVGILVVAGFKERKSARGQLLGEANRYRR